MGHPKSLGVTFNTTFLPINWIIQNQKDCWENCENLLGNKINFHFDKMAEEIWLYLTKVHLNNLHIFPVSGENQDILVNFKKLEHANQTQSYKNNFIL